LFGYLDWFAVGMAFAVFSAFSSAGRPVPKAITALGRFPSASWALAFATFTVQTRLFTSSPGRWISFSLPCLIAITAGFVVLPAVFGRQDEGLIRRGLTSPLMRWLGTISYGIYLWHFTFVSLSIKWVVEGKLANVLFVRFLVVATLTLVAASASFYLVERPLIAWSRRVSRRNASVAGVR
jgi:peptidoglycan/LPS O-acetylase OafA/YrhL